MFKRLRDLASRAITHLRHSEAEEPLDPAKAYQQVKGNTSLEPSGKFAKTYDLRTITDYLWTHAGLNRRERRAIQAKIRRGTATKIDKWMLRTTPENKPATSHRKMINGRVQKYIKSNNLFYAEVING